MHVTADADPLSPGTGLLLSNSLTHSLCAHSLLCKSETWFISID